MGGGKLEIIKEENNLEQKQAQNLELNNPENLGEDQKGFLQGNLGKVINTAVDIGLKAILPDIVEEQIIDIKDSMLKNGLKEGIQTAVSSAIDIGKSALGIVTGKFENISQVQTAIKKGGIIDGISSTIDTVLKSTTKNGLISKDVSKLIKKGKNVILDTVESNIEENFLGQIKGVEKIGKYISNWESYYEKQDLEGMKKEYNKIKTQINEVLPLEETIKKAREIENIQELIKNKGNKIDLSNEEIELAKKLA